MATLHSAGQEEPEHFAIIGKSKTDGSGNAVAEENVIENICKM